MCLIFVGKGYPQKFFNLEKFPNYGTSIATIHNQAHATYHEKGTLYSAFDFQKQVPTLTGFTACSTLQEVVA